MNIGYDDRVKYMYFVYCACHNYFLQGTKATC